MLIPKAMVRRFIDRRRRDLTLAKEWSEPEIEDRRSELPIRPPIWSRLFKVQKICLLLAARYRRLAFLLDTGMGKTMLAIAIARYFDAQGSDGVCIVLVPNRSNKAEWAREILKHSPSTPACVLSGSSADKWEQVCTTDRLFVVDTYAGFVRMVCKKAPKLKNKKGERLVPDRKKVTALKKIAAGLVMDEMTVAKNPRKLPYRICNQISKEADYVVGLTGTPFGRNPEDLWGQLFLVDRGHSLGETLGLFRAAFFKEKDRFWGGKEYKFDKTKDVLLHRFINHCTIRFDADEDDRPQTIPIIKEVRLPQDAEVYYQRARQALIDARGDFKAAESAFMRMRQVSSGFLAYVDEETGKRNEFEFEENPKLDALLDTIESIPPCYKVIVFHEFRVSGRRIAKELGAMGIGHLTINGDTKDPDAVLHSFDHDPKKQVLLLNNQAGGYGLNLQVARYGLYYESPVSAILRRQTERRFERQGSQWKRVFRYDFIVHGTVDEDILRFHKEGRDLFRAIVEGDFTPPPRKGRPRATAGID